MVCSKCQRVLKTTQLATPAVKRKNEMYLGSPTTEQSRTATNGISKVSPAKVNPPPLQSELTSTHQKNKLLSKGAKNPYAAYSSSCEICKKKTETGRQYCQRCAYKKNACAMCGKSISSQDGKKVEPLVQGQKFSAK